MVTLFLEKKTRKNSSNSGLPPSQNFGSNGNRNTKGSKEDKMKGSRLDNSKDTEIRETVSLSSCSECGANLKRAELKGTEDRQEIDIIYEIQTHIVTSEITDCPQCGTENKANFPKGWMVLSNMALVLELQLSILLLFRCFLFSELVSTTWALSVALSINHVEVYFSTQ